MRRLSLDERQQKKGYYRNMYRFAVKLNYYSLLLMSLLIMWLMYLYWARPEPDYYATNGLSAIQALTFLDSANYSSQPLLPPDRPSEMAAKVVNI